MLLFSMLNPLVCNAQVTYMRNCPMYYVDGDFWMMSYGIKWYENVDEFFEENKSEDADFAMYMVWGDTIIDGKEYKRVHERMICFDKVTRQFSARPECPDLFFIREDAEGRQWRRFRDSNDEVLMWDFSKPFEDGGSIAYGKHSSLYDIIMKISPIHHFNYRLKISNLSLMLLPDNSQVQLANERIAFGWGDVENGDAWNMLAPMSENKQNIFICRSHAGQIMFRNDENISFLTRLIGKDVLSLFDKCAGISGIIQQDNTNRYSNINDKLSTFNSHPISTKIVNSKSSNRQFFDLSGHRLAAPPARGLYIEDGKVRVK